MKTSHIFPTAIIVALALCSCQTTETSNDEKTIAEAAPEKMEEVEPINELTEEEAAAFNVYKNMSLLQGGRMLVGFNKGYREMKDEMAEAFNQFADGTTNVQQLDKEIEKLPNDLIELMASLTNKVDSSFKTLRTQDKALYDKIFNNEMLQEGVKIVNKHNLPEGFSSLSENLSKKEIRRYLLKAVVADKFISKLDWQEYKPTDDPLILYLRDAFDWISATNRKFNEDPEIAAFFVSLRKRK